MVRSPVQNSVEIDKSYEGLDFGHILELASLGRLRP